MAKLNANNVRPPECDRRQTERMEALGHLAVGIAHDFNNLLTVILGYSELLEHQLDHDPTRAIVAEIHKAGIQAERLTQKLLAFARQQALTPKVLNLGAVVADCENMLSRLIGEDHSLEITIAPDLGAVKMDPAQVQQILMNLAVNARDAMPRGGSLSIEVDNAFLNASAEHTIGLARSGDYVRLTVRDTGIGMSPATKARIFEPFFTTKEPGKGTGLGLATVDEIVRELCGCIDVESELGRGTTFTIHVPQVQEPVSMDAKNAEEHKVPLGQETILLVDDEDSVRRFAGQVLQACGYTVLEASDGLEALAIARNQPGGIDMLVSDIDMFGLDGQQLAEQVRLQQPRLKVLLVSGHPSDVVSEEMNARRFGFLQKPFTVTSLSRKVRDILDRD